MKSSVALVRGLSASLLCLAIVLQVGTDNCRAATTAASNGVGASLSEASQAVQRYRASGSSSDLVAAMVAMESAVNIDALTPQNFVQQRRQLVQGWAQILKAIDQSYDPTFNPSDPKNIPFVCVAPPREADGRQLLPCANPNDVQDPAARAQYIAAIRANATVAERWNHYQQIARLDQRAMSTLQMSLQLLRSVAPEGSSPDFAAVDSVLVGAGLSSARRAAVDAYFYQSPSN
jgi:hypothetical protein